MDVDAPDKVQTGARRAGRVGGRGTGDAPALPRGRYALQELRSAILDGRLVPGQRLVEDRLSTELGVSRVPIREAIKQLIAEGLAVPARQASGVRGAQVAEVTAEFAAEMIEVRAVLEGLNARLAARRSGPADLARIEALLARGAELSGDDVGLAALNGAYHAMLAEAGANRVLQELMRPLRERTEMVFRRNSTERAAADWREHALILAAVADGDEDMAALLATRHVRRAARIPRSDGDRQRVAEPLPSRAEIQPEDAPHSPGAAPRDDGVPGEPTRRTVR